MRNVALGVVLGLVLGVGLAFLLERLDRRVRDPKEFEELFERPLLASIPDSRALARGGPAQHQSLPTGEQEAFRMLRANLRYFSVDRPVRSVLVSSAAPGDGKTTVSWNLALAAAGTGARQRGTDILLEAPYGPLPTSFEEQLFQLSGRGYRILLAHPERNPSLQRDPARLFELVRRGVLLQVTADSLLPRPPGSRSGEFARSLVANGLAHVLASDAHGPQGPRREPLSAGLAAARALAGAYADWMVEEAPAAILAGEALPPPPAAPRPVRRGLRERLARRERGS